MNRRILFAAFIGLVAAFSTGCDERTKKPSTSQLRYAKATGAARLKIGKFSSESLSIEADGATGPELLAAAYGALRVEAKLAARILAHEVMTEHAELGASDLSFVQVGQVAQLKKNSQGGRIFYQGSPELLQP